MTTYQYKESAGTFAWRVAQQSSQAARDEMLAERASKCEGHPDGPVMGETFFCNGSCRS